MLRTARLLSSSHSFSTERLSTLYTVCYALFKMLMIQYWTKEIKVLALMQCTLQSSGKDSDNKI